VELRSNVVPKTGQALSAHKIAGSKLDRLPREEPFALDRMCGGVNRSWDPIVSQRTEETNKEPFALDRRFAGVMSCGWAFICFHCIWCGQMFARMTERMNKN